MFFDRDKLALISDTESDFDSLDESYRDLGWRLDWHTSDAYDKVVNSNGKYKMVLIDIRLGGGLLSLEIAKLLIRRGYQGKIFFLASGSMEMYTQRYGTVLMKETVRRNPGIIFDVNIDMNEQAMETVFMSTRIAKKGGF